MPAPPFFAPVGGLKAGDAAQRGIQSKCALVAPGPRLSPG